MTGSIRHRLARRKLLSCLHDTFSEDVLFNRILKTTAGLLMRHPQVARERCTALRRQLLLLDHVETVDPAGISWSALSFSRQNVACRMLMGVCRLVIEGMLMTGEDGTHRLADFIDEQRMHRLFEKFVLEFCRQECPQVQAAASLIPWALDDGHDDLLPVMHSDVTLRRGDRALIIDAKYVKFQKADNKTSSLPFLSHRIC